MKSILLVLAVLMGGLIEKGFSSDEQVSLEKEQIVLEAAETSKVDVKRFGPLWSSFYGGVVDYAPDGNRIAVGGPGTVFILNAKTYEIERQLFGHTALVFSIKWSPDGRYIASGAGELDATIKIWEADSGDLIRTLRGHTSEVTAVAWDADGSRLASAQEGGGVFIWDVKTGTRTPSLGGSNAVTWSPDGRYVAAGSFQIVRVYEADTGQLVRTLERHNSVIQAVAWSPDGQYIASSSAAPFDYTVKIWEADTGRLVRTLMHEADPASLAWSPAGDYLACGGGFLKIWKTETWDVVRTLGADQAFLSITSVSWHPDGNHLVSGGEGRIINVWELDTGALLASLEGHRNEVLSIAWSPDGRYLAAGTSQSPFFGYDFGIKIWDIETGRLVRTIPENRGCVVNWIDWSPEDRYLASSTRCGMLRIWEAETGREVKRFEEGLAYISWSPDGRYLAASDVVYRTIRIINSRGWETETELKDPLGLLGPMAWSLDGKYLACSAGGSTIQIFEVGTWELVTTFHGVTPYGVGSLTWSPDSQYLAGIEGACCVTDIKIWELATGRLIRTIDSDIRVMSLMWSPDGKYLASGNWTPNSALIKLWDSETGNLIRTLWGHAENIRTVRWSPDGRYLASGSEDGTIRLWGEPLKE